MTRTPERTTADLSQYPNLVVIYLGMRVNSLRGLKTLASFGPKIRAAVAARPDGLLLHEDLLFSFLPPHAATRSLPHKEWWQSFLPGQRRHRLLGEVLPRWSSRIHLHRHAARGVCQVGHCETGTRLNVLRTPTSRSPWGCGTATGYSGGLALSILTPPAYSQHTPTRREACARCPRRPHDRTVPRERMLPSDAPVDPWISVDQPPARATSRRRQVRRQRGGGGSRSRRRVAAAWHAPAA
jgi:hypothetical protein